MSHLALACVAGVLGVSLPNMSWAWFPLGGELWRDGTIELSFGPTPATPRQMLDWEAAVREAAQAWNSSLQRVQFAVVPPGERVWYENGRNEVFFDRQVFGHAFSSRAIGVSFATHVHGELVENDVVINSAHSWSVYNGAWQRNSSDFRRVVVHELGHVLGLDHPDENGQSVRAIMHSTAGDVEQPTEDDREGTRALYGFGPGAAPVIALQPEPVTVTQGTLARLRVLGGGRGPLRYQWHREGAPMPNGTTTVLEFRTKGEEGGEYFARVWNDAGEVASRTVRLTVRPAVVPVLSQMTTPPSQVAAGDDVTLEARLFRGDAPVRYEWRKDGVAFAAANEPRLMLRDVQFSDAGEYTLTATNAGGSSQPMIYRVNVGPARVIRLFSGVQSANLPPGGRITLSAPISSADGLTFQWQKDGVAIAGATQSSYAIDGYKAEQAGGYTVVVTSAFGSVTSEAGEIGGYAVAGWSIVRQPGAVDGTPGANVSFNVATDAPAATYQWLKDGQPLADAAGRTGVRADTLQLQGIGGESAGVYAVEVSDGTRRLRSRGARLTVRAPDQSFLIKQHPSPHSVMIGESVRLETIVFPADRLVACQWFKNGVPIPGAVQSGHVFVATAGDAGRYKARVIMTEGILETEEAEVELVSSPSLLGAHPPSRVYIDNTEELRLGGVADEVARRRAEREGGVYFYTRDRVQVQSIYNDRNAWPATYTFTRGVGSRIETSKPFSVAVVPPLGAPTIQRHPRGGAYPLGGTVELQVTASSLSNTTYAWFLNGTRVIGEQSPMLRLPAFTEREAGTYTVMVTNASGQVSSEPAVVEILGLETPLIATQPLGRVARPGETVELWVASRRSGVQYQWFKDGAAVAGATNSFVVVAATVANAGSYTVRVSDGVESALSRPAVIRLLANGRAPEIWAQPVGTTAMVSGDAVLSVGADGDPLPAQYQWRKDGVPIAGATDAKLRLTNVQAANAGIYSVVVSNALGTATSQAALLAIDERARLVNLATRASVGLGADFLIAGFTLSGTQPRTVLVRGIGDQLVDFGVRGVLRDPVVTIFDARARELATNDDWWRTSEESTAALEEAARQVGAFAQQATARDAAVLTTLPPGSYTVQVSGLIATTGVGLVEIYEMGKAGANRLVNLSSRAVVGTDANILIPGFVLSGVKPRRMLVRAVGPGLVDFGLTGALADPTLAVFRGEARIAENDNWGDGGAAAAVAEAGAAVGAFPLKTGSRDAAVVVELAPGSYTVQVAGARRTTGTALVEIYELP